MPRINLLPWRESERKRKRQEFILSIGAAVATAALVTLVGRWHMGASIEHQNDRNRLLGDEIAELDKQIKEIDGLESQKRRLLARMEIIETLQRSRPEIVHILDEIVRILPEGVYLTYLVSAFMRNIDSSEWLADPALRIVETKGRDGGRGADFTLFATQRSRVTPEQAAEGETVASK
jgi:type IV pilus assembly protein PilN